MIAGGNNAKPHKKKAYVAALRKFGNVAHACKAVGVARSTPWKWAQKDPAFQKAIRDAVEDAADRLEKEAIRRAARGVKEPVFHRGVVVGHVTRYSDTLLIFLLKGMRPNKYRESAPAQQQTTEQSLTQKQIAELRNEIRNSKDYLDFLRTRNGNGNGHARTHGATPE